MFCLKGHPAENYPQDYFSWPKSIYYCDLSLTNCTFVKLELRVQGTHFHGELGNLTSVVALIWEFGASGYIT